MTDQEIVQALRCTSTPGGHASNCEQCPYWKKEQLTGRLKEKLGTDAWTSCDIDKIGLDAANLIERLTAENAKAEAERDALIKQIKERHDCLDCKHNDFCEFDGALVFDCMNCVKYGCPCIGCCDSSRWEWRGLPEAPAEGEKA